jgi:hypothetical protein
VTPTHATPAQQLARLLDLPHPPVAVTFVQAGDEPAAPAPEPIPAQPAGCCFWEPAQRRTLDTRAENHANCSVGSYTHGSYTHGLIPLPHPTASSHCLIPLQTAATGQDAAVLVGSGWVTETDLGAATGRIGATSGLQSFLSGYPT